MADKIVIFNEEFNGIFDQSVNVAKIESEAPQIAAKEQKFAPILDDNLSCSYCRVTFPNVPTQREHYRLDWHRYNLKLSLQVKPPIAEEEFSRKNENDEVSSISGSDSEEEEQDFLDALATTQGKIFLQNKAGQVFSVYRGVLLINKKEEIASVNLYNRYKDNCWDNKQWAVLMLGGGHFAGAIFNYLTPLVHKTFHCYTVRQGQGGSQSSRDNKSAGAHPKSAGASLRRYNEQALTDHVSDIVSNWAEQLKKCSLIFYRASGPFNRGVLFGGKEPLLDRNDQRLRTIPFSTGRATYTEVKRVHLELCSASMYGSINEAIKSPEKVQKQSKSRINRAKSREPIERPLPGSNSEENLSRIDLATSKLEDSNEDEVTNLSRLELEDSNEEDVVLDETCLEVSFEDLEEFGDSLTPEQRKKGQIRKKPKKSKNQKLKEKEDSRKQNLINIVIKGNTLFLEDLLQERLKVFKEDINMSKQEISKEIFNEILDESGNSFLHLAAMNEHEEMLRFLLENQADPCLKNKNQQTPYSVTNSKLSRDVFRKFAKDNPEMYNYNKAQIPVNTLTDEEIAEKKRAMRKVKREKEKEKRKENHMKKQENEHKDRFLSLSDREKRALAAERRILNAQGKVVARCFLCGSDMAGKVPFEYLENRFCSIECLKGHRMKTPI